MLEKARTVDAQVRYINAEWKTRPETPRIGSRETRRAATSFQEVKVHDARPRFNEGQIDLDRSGFTLSNNASNLTDFHDSDAVQATYYKEMSDLVCRVSGADQALVRSHLVRTESPVDFNDGYARFVHCDYNVRRLREMSEELLEQQGITPKSSWRYAWYNTWQPFDNIVEQNPLAVIDWESLPLEDVIDYFYTGRGMDSLVAAPVYSTDHKFCYFPTMQLDEVLVMKQMDERPDRAVYCPHTSFDDPTAPTDALPRRSIETRLMAVFQ
ncbi:MAG: hypothetical protein ACI8PT_001380 [Gammaproteobacteria bacterium]|jgi:hypothetical protein